MALSPRLNASHDAEARAGLHHVEVERLDDVGVGPGRQRGRPDAAGAHRQAMLVETLLLLQPQPCGGCPGCAATPAEDRPADGARALPPARPRVAPQVAQQVVLGAAASVRVPPGVAARVAALPALPVLLLPLAAASALAAVVEAVDGEEGGGAEERAGEAEVVAGLGLTGQVEVAHHGQPEEERDGTGALQGCNSTEF